MEIFLFICNLLIPLIMTVSGYLMYKKPPNKINNLIGYRTTMSMKNTDTWQFSHNYCGKLWIKLGIILTISSIIVQIPFINLNENTFSIATIIIELIQFIFLILSIINVEHKLKLTFDKDGNRRD